MVFLLSALLELRIDGFSEFLKKRNLGTFDIHANMIHEFRKNLAKLITIRKKQEAEEFFLSKLSYQSYVIQYCGSLMCYFIALSLAKNTTKKPIIIVGSEQHPLESINEMLNGHENFFVRGLTTETFDSAYALISKMGPIEFLNTYNQACDQFGIDDNNRVLW